MEKIAYLQILDHAINCVIYNGGRPDSAVTIPRKDWYDIPYMLKGFQERNISIRFSDPPRFS